MTHRPRPPMPDDLYDDDVDAPSGRSNAGHVLLLLLLGIGGFFALRHFAWSGSAMADWHHDWDRGLSQAEASGKPLLVMFTADWCPPCRTMKADVLEDAEVSRLLRDNFTLVKIDLTDRADEAAHGVATTYGVGGIPAFIMFNTRGAQVDRLVGGAPKEAFIAWIEGNLGRSKQ